MLLPPLNLLKTVCTSVNFGSESIFLHSCISCDFKTNDYISLTFHIDENHRPAPVPPTNVKETHVCEQCNNTFETQLDLEGTLKFCI